MDPTRFDELTKSLTTKTSRRQALKTFVATAFSGVLTLSGLGRAFAKKKCPPGQTNCGGKCVNTSNDPNNCGVCGTVCISGLCVSGLCCASGAVQCGTSCCTQTCCGSTCVDTNFDPNNCGGCGNVCSTGACCNAACVDLSNDPHNCGSCGNVCPSGATCKNGKCVSPGPMCPMGGCKTSFVCGGPPVTCGPGGVCLCLTTVEGTLCCGDICGNPCSSSSDCPSGWFCQAAGTGCCGQVCIRNCPGASAPLQPGERANWG